MGREREAKKINEKKRKEQESNYIYQPPCFMMSTSTIYVYIYIYNQEKKIS